MNLPRLLEQKTGLFWKLASREYLYHITFFKNLSSIAERGLVEGGGELLGHGGNRGRSQGAVFFTDKSGIMYWYSKVVDIAEHGSDNVLEDEVIPVVLRTEKGEGEREDPTAEIHSKEYKRGEGVAGEDLEIWDGASWIPVWDYWQVDITQAVDEREEDGEKLYYFKYINRNPLVPGM